jgi:hypothetical protein
LGTQWVAKNPISITCWVLGIRRVAKDPIANRSCVEYLDININLLAFTQSHIATIRTYLVTSLVCIIYVQLSTLRFLSLFLADLADSDHMSSHSLN